MGESWEFSCDPDFPSLILGESMSLKELIEKTDGDVLGDQAQEKSCQLLVKLISTSMPLSIQVHPADNDPNLQAHESGKPESWLILDHKPSAGIYLGIKPGADLSQLKNSKDLHKVMNFIEVQKNDYFEITPGTPHAIGDGVTLLEPQRILFGKSGKTFRLSDWQRRYNSKGELDPQSGSPRDREHRLLSPVSDDFERAPSRSAPAHDRQR